MPKSKKKKNTAPTGRTSKEQKLFDNLLKTIEQFMTGRSYKPMAYAELMERLSLPEQHEELFKEILHALIKSKKVELEKERYSWFVNRGETITGIIRLHPRGFGFVQPDTPLSFEEDIFIPKHLTQNAVDGDQVEVLIFPDQFTEKGPEGKIVSILSRGRTHLAGIVMKAPKRGELLGYAPLLGSTQNILIQPDPAHPLKEGDRIIMEVLEWGDKFSDTLCKFSSYIGHISDPSCDIEAAIQEYEIRSTFPPRVIKEAKNYGKSVSRKDIGNREDLRDLETFTIDPDTAKDFDDALSLTKDNKGHYHLGVHIADVSHYVTPGSELDNEAALRCNSTYLPGTCISMLPSVLSDNLCSLKEKVNRLTVSVLVDFDDQGNMLHYRIIRAVIKSSKRFTYKEAKKVLDGEKRSKHAPTLHLMVELCKLLKRKRYDRGSIEFAIPDLIVIVDKQGTPLRTEYVEYDITHQLVEEFMLKANEVVATHITQQGKFVTYRIHDVPSEENMKEFAALANAFGYDLPDKPTQLQLQQMFDKALGTPYGQHLASSFIRRMRLAVYSPENIGHYGLALTHYCHFTSPIRRYVDLVAHRIIFGEDLDFDTLANIAKMCSDKERVSAKAENSVVLLKKLRLLNEVKQKEPLKEYEAIVTRVKPHGIVFEVLHMMIEGFLHVSELENDYYVFEERQNILRGRHSGKTYHAGERISVLLNEVDLITLDTRWNIVASEEDEAPKKQKSRKRKHSR